MSTPRSRSISIAKLAVPLITLVLSIVAIVIGYLLTSSGLSSLNTALAGGTATAVDVYGGQSQIGVASAVLSAGIISVVVSLAAIGVIIALAPRTAAVAPVDEFDEERDADDELELVEVVEVVETEPVVAPAGEAVVTAAEPKLDVEPKADDAEVTPARP